MFELWHYLAFILACVVVVIVPGPTVTVIDNLGSSVSTTTTFSGAVVSEGGRLS